MGGGPAFPRRGGPGAMDRPGTVLSTRLAPPPAAGRRDAGRSGSGTARAPYPGTGMTRRDLLALLGLAALAATLAGVQMATGVAPDVLIAAPGLLLLLPLAAGRYVGEDGLARFARPAPRPRYPGRPAPALRRGIARAVPRGGLLIAVALAHRGPPAGAFAH